MKRYLVALVAGLFLASSAGAATLSLALQGGGNAVTLNVGEPATLELTATTGGEIAPAVFAELVSDTVGVISFTGSAQTPLTSASGILPWTTFPLACGGASCSGLSQANFDPLGSLPVDAFDGVIATLTLQASTPGTTTISVNGEPSTGNALTFFGVIAASAGTVTIEVVEPGGSGDSDGDGVPDDEDICPGGDDTVDTDNDGVPDDCDSCPVDAGDDSDGDGVCDSDDICPDGDDTLDTDNDGVPDDCDDCPLDPENDADSDGFCESDDNCPDVANPDQANLDGDDEGDVCDADVDGDGVPNGEDNCEFDHNPDQDDFDDDGVGDACDADTDDDGVIDGDDACVPTAPGEIVDADGCSIAQLCPCDNGWKNHGAYVSCVARTAKDFVDAGLLGGAEKGAVVSEAAQFDCGHKK